MLSMSIKLRQQLTIAVLAVGLGLLAWGAKFHAQPVFSENNDKGLLTAESKLIKEVSIGGVVRDPYGKLRMTYTGEAPQSCPT
jgi:hypothetical protein